MNKYYFCSMTVSCPINHFSDLSKETQLYFQSLIAFLRQISEQKFRSPIDQASPEDIQKTMLALQTIRDAIVGNTYLKSCILELDLLAILRNILCVENTGEVAATLINVQSFALDILISLLKCTRCH